MIKLRFTAAAGCLLALIGISYSEAEACGVPSDIILAQAFLGRTYPDALHVTGATWTMQQAGVLAMPNRERIVATGERRIELDDEAHLADLDALELLGASFHTNSQSTHLISLVLIDGMHWARFTPDPAVPYDAANFNCAAANRTVGDMVVVTTKPVLHAIRTGDVSISKAVGHGAIRLYGNEQQKDAFLLEFGLIGGSDLLKASPENSLLAQLAKAAEAKKPWQRLMQSRIRFEQRYTRRPSDRP